MKQTTSNQVQSPYNKVVRECHRQILKYARTLLSTIEHEELRFTLVREDRKAQNNAQVIHELISPLLYLRLESYTTGVYSIHYGFEQFPIFGDYYAITAAFVRFIYKVTTSENTSINIEDAVRVDWLISNCSEMYEHVEEQMKHHQFHLIKHKPAANRRKQMKAVA